MTERSFQEVLAKLKEAVKKAIDEALQKLTGAIEQLQGIADKVLEEARKKLDKIVNLVVGLLDKIVANAIEEETGVDVSKCIKGKPKKVKDMAVQTFEHIKACVDSRLSELMGIVKVIGEEVQAAWADVEAVENKYKECDSPLCFAGLMIDVNKLLISIPLKVAKIAAKSAAIVVKANTQLGVCVAKDIASLTAKLTILVKTTQKCVEGKVKPEESRADMTPYDVHLLLNQMIENVQTNIDESDAKMEQVRGVFHDQVTVTVNLAKADIEAKANEVATLFDDFVVTAQQSGQDITECIAERPQEIIDLAVKSRDKVERCATVLEEGVQEFFDMSTEAVNDVIVNTEDIEMEFYQCADMACINDVHTKVMNAQIWLPMEIDNYVNRFFDFININSVKLSYCASNPTMIFEKVSGKIIKDVKKCIAEMMY